MNTSVSDLVAAAHQLSKKLDEPDATMVRQMATHLDIQAGSVKKHRETANSELKPANLINKFYERYPLSEFKNDSERATALGYFMAGAELQCFGEYVKYEDMFIDE